MPLPTTTAHPRLVSLDALRGFDMFWILGSGGLLKALQAFGSVEPANSLAWQFDHARWEGLHFEDVIFPLFVFIAGVSLVFALTKTIGREGRWPAARRIAGRALVLFALGVFYNGGFRDGLDHVRWVGVLQRIALAYLGAGLLFLWLKPRGLIVACAVILFGWWAVLAYAPIVELDGIHPAAENLRFAERFNVCDAFDRNHLPGRKYNRDHDPEGLLSNIPAVATCLLGVFAGLWLRSEKATPSRKSGALLAAGLLLLALGWAWAGWCPVIKKIWTSSYVLETGGWSALLLGVFYYLIDVRGWQRWARPFVWIGMNPITLYLVANVLIYHEVAARFTGRDTEAFLNTHLHPGTGILLTTLLAMGLNLLLARFLYTRKIFLRV